MNKKNKNIFRGIFLLAFIMLNLIFSGNKVFAVKHVAHEKDPNNVYLIENRQNFLRVVTGSPDDKTQAGNYEPTALGAADWSLCLQKGKAYPNFDPAKPPHFSQLFFDEDDLLKYFQNPGNQYIGLYTMQENVSPDDFVDAIKDANKAGHTPDTEDSYTVYITAKNLMYLFAQDPENIANGQRASYYSVIQDELWHFINSQQRSNWSNSITKDKANRVRAIIDKHYGKDDLIPRYIQATIDVYRSAWWGGKKGVQNTATLRMDYLREKVEFEKVNENNVKLGGAEIEITKLESEKVNIYDNHIKDPEENYNKTFTTVADKNHFIDMREGVYKFHEKKAPKGHKTVPDFKFKVTIDGKVELVEPSDEVKKLVKVDGFKLIIKDESEIFEHDVKKVSFTKYGINYKLAKGAELEIYEKDTDKKVAQWTTDGKNNWELTLPAGKRYRFHEKKAPAGCKLIKDFEFTVHKEEGKATELHNVADTSKVYLQGSQVIVIDEEKPKKEIQIEKLSDDSKALAGAEFELYIKGEPVPIDRWTSTTDIRKTKVYPGVVYTIKETKVPEGKKYKKIADFDFSVEDNGNIKLEGSPADVKATGNKLSITNTYPEKFRIGFAKKKSILDPTFLTDARFEVHDEKGNVVEKWWTVNKITHFEIKPGKYTVKEVVNPKGYEEISDFVFELKKDGTFIIENYDKIKTDGTKTGVLFTQATSDTNQWEGSIPLVTMVDRQLKEKKVTISKINQNNEKISGARLEIWRFNGITTTTTTHIADLDTTDKDQEVTLNFERTYLISETHAPDGYKKIQDFKLQVDDKGEMKLIDNPNKDLVKLDGDKLIIKDPKNEKDIFISKINELNKRVANAKFDIFESTNLTKPLGTLTSKAEGEDANIKVSFGKEYVIKEKEAPEGYNKVNDFKIKVGEDGTITFVGNHERVTIDGNKLKIKDPFKEYPVILKKVDEEGNALGGVQFKIYSKRENGNYGWDDNWNSNKEYSKGLWPNEYKVEEEQTPEGYEPIDPFEFEVKANGTIELKGENKNVSVDKNTATITIKNNFKKYPIKISKIDQVGNLLNDRLNPARLNIFTVKDGKETQFNTWHTNIQPTFNLKAGVYKLKETQVPNGYEGIGEILFEVKSNGEIEVKSNSSNVQIENIENNAKEVKVINRKKKEVTISKVDPDRKNLKGASLEIYDSENTDKALASIDTTEADSKVSLVHGKKYLVKETKVPQGYEKINDFEFEISKDGNISLINNPKHVSLEENKLVIVDQLKTHKVKFKKVDQDNKQLNTARLEIYSQDDTRIEGWNTNIIAEVSLKPGVYKLKETKTPDGYKAISEITFTVKLDGSVELTNNENASLEGNLITVKNKKKDVPPPPPEKPKKTLKLTVHKLLLSKDEFDKWKSPDAYNASQDKADFDKLVGHNVQEIADVYFVWKNEKDQYIDAKGNVVDSIDKALGQLTKPSGAEFDTSKLPDGTYKIYEVKEKSTYSGLNGEVLTEMKAAPIEIKLPFENEKGVVEHVHVYPKNTSDKPKIDKNFDETVTDQGVDNTLDVINYQREKSKINRTIGDNIPYAVKTIIPLGSEYKKLIWTDNMTEGLSFNKDVVVEGAGITKGDYEIVEDERGFSLSLNESGLEKVKNACKNVELEIMLKYSATLNAKASINLDKNQENTIALDYSNTPSKSSEPLENNPIDGKIKVEKSWDKDGNNQVTDADKNVAVTYILEEKNGNGYSEVSSVTLRYDKANPNQSFSYEFTGLDNTKTYRVRERVGGYEPKYISFDQGVLKITNNANKTYLRPSNPKVVTYGKKFVKVDTQDDRLLGAIFAIKKDGKYLKAKSVGRRTQDKEILKQAKDKLSEALDAYNNLKPEQIGKEDETKAKNLIASSQEAFNKAFENEGIGFEYTTDLNDADLIKLTSNENGQFMIKGLGAGNYELEELKAPNGYAKLRNVRFVVDENSFNNGDIKYSDDSKTNDASRVINKKISIPQTGGIGSLIFMLIGLSLMVFAFLKYKRSLNISESNNMNI